MNKEFRTYLFLIAVLVFFWLNGSIIDSALWFHAGYRTPAWIVNNLSIFWLVFSQALAPFLMVIVLKPKWNTVIAFFAAGCWGSLGWDLLYGLLTRGTMIFDMDRWFTLDASHFIVGFTGIWVLLFHIARLLIGAGLLILLYRRTKAGEALSYS